MITCDGLLAKKIVLLLSWHIYYASLIKCVQSYIWTHACIYVHTSTCVHLYTLPYTQTHAHTHTHTYTFSTTLSHLHVLTHLPTYALTHLPIYALTLTDCARSRVGLGNQSRRSSRNVDSMVRHYTIIYCDSWVLSWNVLLSQYLNIITRQKQFTMNLFESLVGNYCVSFSNLC